MDTPPLATPQPPEPTRLRRTVLLLVLGIVAATGLVAVLALVDSGRARPPAAPAPPPPQSGPAQPDFLERPPSPAPATPSLEELLARHPDASAGPAPEELGGLDPSDPSMDPSAGPLAGSPPPPPDPRAERLRQALLSPLQPRDAAAGRAARQAADGPAVPPALPSPRELRELLLPPGLPAAPPAAPAAAVASSAPAGGSPASPSSTELAYTHDRTPRPFRLQAGTVLPALLLTAVSSDLPGALVAQLERDVYDSTRQMHLLLPRGSRLVGRYQNQVAVGQNRLLVAWDRILFPDGTSLTLPGLPGTMRDGAAGLAGKVDNHYARVFGNAILLSLLSAGVQLSQPQQSATAGVAPSSGQVAAGALGQELGAVALELVRRNVNIPPTLTLPAGLQLSVYLSADLTFPRPYRPVSR